MTRSDAARRVRGIYAVTPDRALDDGLLERIGAILAGGVGILQYRAKTTDAAERRRAAEALRTVCSSRGALFVVNDDVDLAVAVGADGVHVGREDAPVAEARRRLGPGRLVGASCYGSMALARSAVAAGADYIAFGSVFPSRTKPDAARASLELFAQARTEFEVPRVAIGGIDAHNLAAAVAAGADAVAVVSALFDAADAGAAARDLTAKFVAADGARG